MYVWNKLKEKRSKQKKRSLLFTEKRKKKKEKEKEREREKKGREKEYPKKRVQGGKETFVIDRGKLSDLKKKRGKGMWRLKKWRWLI